MNTSPSMNPLGTGPRPWHGLNQGLGAIAATVLGVCLPFSSAGISIGMALVLLSCLFLAPSVWRARPTREPVALIGLALFAYLAVHSWLMSGLSPTPWPMEAGKVIGKYQELWMLPLLWAWFRAGGQRRWFFHALVLGTLAYAAVHWLTLWGLPLLPPDFLPARRISAGLVFMGVAWVALMDARQQARPWIGRTVALVLCLTVLFAMDGRTGHVLLLVLVPLAGLLHAQGRVRWAVAAGLLALLALGALNSKVVQGRMGDTLSAAQSSSNGDFSSAQVRRAYYVHGLALALEHPWLGVGVGNIGPAYHARLERPEVQANQAKAFAATPYSKPSNLHNEYLMQWAGAGLPALLLFLAWLAAPVLRRSSSHTARWSVWGLVLAFAVGCLFNAWLLDFIEGHLYVALLAWLLSAPQPLQPPATGAAARP